MNRGNVKSMKVAISFFLFIHVLFLMAPILAHAQTQDQGGLLDLNKCTKIKDDPPVICLQVKIGALDRVSGISQYISNFYNFFVGAVATLAIFMIVIGGVRWLFARGNPGKIGAAKKTIESAVLGMLLVFVSVALLRIINPDLISLKVPGLTKITPKFIGVEWCKDAPKDNVEFRETKTQQVVPANDVQANSFPCGKEYEFYAIDDPKKELNKLQCLGHVCTTGHCNKQAKECAPMYVTGMIQADRTIPEGSTSAYDIAFPTELSLRVVCNINDSSNISEYALLNEFDFLSLERDFTDYNFFVGKRQFEKTRYNARAYLEACGRDDDTYAGVGYALQASIYDYNDQTSDDYILKKDCSGPATLVDPSDLNKKKNSSDWQAMIASMFTDDDFRNPVVCNLDVDRKKFPRR